MPNRYEQAAPNPRLSRELRILPDQYQEDASLVVQIDHDGGLHITQGADLIVVSIELWERIATEVMSAVMQLRRDQA